MKFLPIKKIEKTNVVKDCYDLKVPIYENFLLANNILTHNCGKTVVLKYYGHLLNLHSHMSTNGISTSVAGLRGTRETITIINKEYKIISKGHLGMYKTIHIDEAGEDKLLIKNLKTFLYESNYSYDKAGSEYQSNKRTAHCNISENLDYNHVGQYRGAIRKAYKENILKIGNDEKIDWDEEWDLHQPLYKYDNPYLLKVIKEKRSEYQMKQQFWIDGYDYALHERFPFYFYLVDEKRTGKFDAIKTSNSGKKIITNNNVLISIFENDDIDVFFKGLEPFIFIDDYGDSGNIVRKILKSYGIHADARMEKFYIMLVNLSRIINKRNFVDEADYKLLQWFIEKTNCKLDIEGTDDYKVEGFPDMQKEKDMEKKIEEESRTVDDFGLPSGEF